MTIKDVAAYCGVAVSTVSRVLNNHPDVSDETRERVLAAVRELHYVPNNSARDLVMAPADSIGLVVRGAENPFYTPIIHAVEESCERAGHTMVLHQIPVGADEIQAGAELARAKRLRGLVFLGGRFDYTREDGKALGVPFVCCTNTNQFGNLPKTAFSSVSIDDLAEGYRATQLLIERGHRNIAIVLDSIHDHSISELRYRGYCQALYDAGIQLDPQLVVETVDFTMEAAHRRMSELLERRRDFTAVFADADTLAIASMKALHDAGISVPGDCSMVAIDGIEMSRYITPTLSTLVQPQEELGRKAAALLLGVLAGEPHGHVRLQTELRAGETLAPAIGNARIATDATEEKRGAL